MLGFKSSQMGRNKKYSLGRYQIVLPPIDFFFRIPAFPDANVTCFVFFFNQITTLTIGACFRFFTYRIYVSVLNHMPSEKRTTTKYSLIPDLHNPATIEFTPGRVHAPQRDLSSPLRVFVYPLLEWGQVSWEFTRCDGRRHVARAFISDAKRRCRMHLVYCSILILAFGFHYRKSQNFYVVTSNRS